MTLTEEQMKVIVSSLLFHINYIQTGDPKNKKPKLIKPLTEEQMRAILSMKDAVKLFESVLSTSTNARLIGV